MVHLNKLLELVNDTNYRQLCSIFCGNLSVCPCEYCTTDSNQSSVYPEKGRHNHQKFFRGVHEIFLSSKHQSKSAIVISPVPQFHPYFPENSHLLGDKFLYYFLVSPWSIIFISREQNKIQHENQWK